MFKNEIFVLLKKLSCLRQTRLPLEDLIAAFPRRQAGCSRDCKPEVGKEEKRVSNHLRGVLIKVVLYSVVAVVYTRDILKETYTYVSIDTVECIKLDHSLN